MTPFWWGSSISTKQANYDGTVAFPSGAKIEGVSRHGTVEVGSFAPNAWGFFRVHGNVWEWTQDCYDESRPGGTPDGSAWLNGDCNRRILRGGSFDEPPKKVVTHSRRRDTTDTGNADYGLRVGRSISDLEPAHTEKLKLQATVIR